MYEFRNRILDDLVMGRVPYNAYLGENESFVVVNDDYDDFLSLFAIPRQHADYDHREDIILHEGRLHFILPQNTFFVDRFDHLDFLQARGDSLFLIDDVLDIRRSASSRYLFNALAVKMFQNDSVRDRWLPMWFTETNENIHDLSLWARSSDDNIRALAQYLGMMLPKYTLNRFIFQILFEVTATDSKFVVLSFMFELSYI